MTLELPNAEWTRRCIELLEQAVELRAEVERLQAQLAEDAADHNRCMEVLGERIERLLAACERMMIGGNHIATYRTERWPDYGSEPMDALEKLGAGREYDMWCCWNAIMCARDSLEPKADVAALLPELAVIAQVMKEGK